MHIEVAPCAAACGSGLPASVAHMPLLHCECAPLKKPRIASYALPQLLQLHCSRCCKQTAEPAMHGVMRPLLMDLNSPS